MLAPWGPDFCPCNKSSTKHIAIQIFVQIYRDALLPCRGTIGLSQSLTYTIIFLEQVFMFSNQGNSHPWEKQLWPDNQGFGDRHCQRPGAGDIWFFTKEVDWLTGQVPGLAVPGGTWFTRLVQSGDQNSAYSLFRWAPTSQKWSLFSYASSSTLHPRRWVTRSVVVSN